MEPRGAIRGALGVLLLALFPCVAVPADGAGKLVREYDLKAAFLFNFAQFVEWPADAFPDADTPITICILGDDPLGGSLDEIIANEVVRNRRLVVRRYRAVEESTACHILYVSPSETAHVDQILAYLNHRSILTVGETEGFSGRSGMIRFVVAGTKVRLRINLEAARAGRLTISSKLLRLAEIVSAEPVR